MSGFTWHQIPQSSSTCTVHLLQAGSLLLPEDLCLLPAPDTPNKSLQRDVSDSPTFRVPDYCFLVHHPPSKSNYIFDLGMRKDLHNLPPVIVRSVLPVFKSFPKSPAEILREHGSPEQKPEKVKGIIFSHVHFDHVGDGGKAGFEKNQSLELWVGPTGCTYARPGYPVKEDAPVLTDTLPVEGKEKVFEPFISDEDLTGREDERKGIVSEAQKKGLYKGVDLSVPASHGGWRRVGAFERAFDFFGDGSAFLIDAPGHVAGHQMLLVRVKSGDPSNGEDDFVLLSGDCYHHPALLIEPRRTARPPYSKGGMHSNAEVAMETIARTREFFRKENIWVLGAHDFNVGAGIAPSADEIEGLVDLAEWRQKGWKLDYKE